MKKIDLHTILTPTEEKQPTAVTKSRGKSVSKWILWIFPIITLTMISFYLITEFQQSNYAVLTRVRTEVAETKSMVLPDGSSVILYPGSTLRYPKDFTGDVREVYLEGAAFFDVKESSSSFVVHGMSLNVKSNKASFNYRGYAFQTALNLQLVSGELELVAHKDRKKHYNLNEGHWLIFNPDLDEWEVKKSAMKDVGKPGYVWFEQTPLNEVVKYIDLNFNTRTELSEGLENCTVHFEGLVSDPAAFYKIVARALNLELQGKASNYLLKGQACQS